MLQTTFNKFLDAVGYEDNVWLRPTDLHYIILDSDANQFFNPKLQKICFDYSNKLIKIKYSELFPITSILSRFTYSDNTLYFNNAYSTIYYKKTIREPKVGDYVCACDPKTKQTTRSIIKTITSDVYGNKRIELLDSDVINVIKAATHGLRFYIWLQEYSEGICLDNPAEFYTAKDTTEYDADIYIGIDRVCGFEFGKSGGYV